MDNEFHEVLNVLTPGVCLQTAARRFWMDEYATWLSKYVDLQSAGKSQRRKFLSSSSDYTKAAYAMFPRYRLAKSVLREVERIEAESLSLEKVQKQLIEAPSKPTEQLLEEFRSNKIALGAILEERNAFLEYIRLFSVTSLQRVEPLPFRRVLSRSQSQAQWSLLKDQWGIGGAGFSWHPLSEDPLPISGLTFHQDFWNARNGDAILKAFFQSCSLRRCFLLYEIEPADYEIDVELADPLYRGSEQFLTSVGDWVLYSSHESSLTLAGSIASFFRSKWEDADNFPYGGPYSTLALRGTWNA